MGTQLKTRTLIDLELQLLDNTLNNILLQRLNTLNSHLPYSKTITKEGLNSLVSIQDTLRSAQTQLSQYAEYLDVITYEDSSENYTERSR